ncbi:MAG: CHAT domain-containing protein [Cyanobacteria bacterium J06638_22]
MVASLDSFDALQAAVAIAEQHRQRGDLSAAYDAYLAIATRRFTQQTLTRADLIVLRLLADLATLFGDYAGATSILSGITGLYADAGNEQWADFTRCQQIHLAIEQGAMAEVEALLRAMQPRIGNIRQIQISEAGLNQWEATCQWSGTTLSDRRILFIHLYLALGRWLVALGQYGSGQILLQRGLVQLEDATDSANGAEAIATQAQIPLYLTLARAQGEKGDFAIANTTLSQVDTLLSQQPDPSFAIHVTELRGKLCLLQGQLGNGLECFQKIVQQLQTLSFHRPVLRATLNLAEVLILLNQTQQADTYLAAIRQDVQMLSDDGLQQTLRQLEQLSQLRRRSLISTTTQSNQAARQTALTPPEPPGASTSEPESAPVPWKLCRSASYLTTFERGCLPLQLALAQFDFATAQQHLQRLKQAFHATDSAIVQQRLALWKAIAHYYDATTFRQDEHPPDPERVSSVAQQLNALTTSLRSVGLLPDVYLAQQYASWCEARLAPENVTAAAQWQAVQALQQQLVETLRPQDQAMYLLNKWTAEEAAIATTLNRLQQQQQRLKRHRWWQRPKARWAMLKQLHQQLQRLDHYKQIQSYQARTGESTSPLQATPQPLWRCLLTHPRRRLTLAFLVLPDRVLVVCRGWLRLDFHILPTTRLMLRNTVQAWHQALATAGRSRTLATHPDQDDAPAPMQSRERLEAIATELSQHLQLEGLLQNSSHRITSLAIVPDSSLHGFPFTVLPYQGKTLIQRFALSHTYDLLSPFHRQQQHQPAQALVVGIGQPLTITSDSEMLLHLSALPGVYPELHVITQQLQQQRIPLVTPHPLVQETATKAMFLRHLPQATWLHLACHGIFMVNRPDRSGLVFSNGTTTDQGEQGAILSLRELSYLNLQHLQQVVLSACWSADHYVLPGRWVISLPETLHRAGTQSILGALWEVDDRFAIPFMTQFYAYLTKLPRDHALKQTQLDCLRGTLPNSAHLDTTNPFYWSSFALYGNPNRVGNFRSTD